MNWFNWKMRMIEKLLGKSDYILILHKEGSDGNHHGYCLANNSDENATHLKQITLGVCESKPEVKSLLFECVKTYLDRYEIDARNFAKEIYPKI